MVENNSLVISLGSELLLVDSLTLLVNGSSIDVGVLDEIGENINRCVDVGTQGLGRVRGDFTASLSSENTTNLVEFGSLTLMSEFKSSLLYLVSKCVCLCCV